MSVSERLKVYIEFTRPFTLLPPLLGMVSGSITAFGKYRILGSELPLPPRPGIAAGWAELLAAWSGEQGGLIAALAFTLIGALMASCLNAASNVLNQWADLDIDRRNKPERPLPSGRVSKREFVVICVSLYLLSLALAWFIGWQCFAIVCAGAAFTYIYSMPPLRTKRWGEWANLTIAVPRGCLLKVAGWSCVATVCDIEPWFIGSIFMFFLLGASTTKDYSDMVGDKAGGVISLPIKYGVKRAAYMTSPSFTLPWLLIPLGVARGVLSGNALLLVGLSAILFAWGVYTTYLILRDPEQLAKTENHPSWTHMYLMMMTAQIGFAVAYLI